MKKIGLITLLGLLFQYTEAQIDTTQTEIKKGFSLDAQLTDNKSLQSSLQSENQVVLVQYKEKVYPYKKAKQLLEEKEIKSIKIITEKAKISALTPTKADALILVE